MTIIACVYEVKKLVDNNKVTTRSTVSDKVDTKIELRRLEKGGWKREVIDVIESYFPHLEVIGVNKVENGDGFQVSVVTQKRAISTKKKPVTIGGRPVGRVGVRSMKARIR